MNEHKKEMFIRGSWDFIFLEVAITMALADIRGYTAKKCDRIDIAPNEKARGITINSVHVRYETSL